MIDRIVPIIVALVLIAGTSTNAQTTPRAFTFTPRPSDQTKSFLLTEFSLGRQFGNYTLDGEKRSESEGVAGWELGYMRNVSPHWALGISVFLNAGDWRSQLGVKPRARYWLGKRSSIDFGAGPILKTIGEDHLTHVGISSHVGINANSWLGFDIGMEYVKFDGTQFAPGGESMVSVEGDRTSLSLCLRLGGLSGAIAGVAVPAIVAALIYVALNNSDGY